MMAMNFLREITAWIKEVTYSEAICSLFAIFGSSRQIFDSKSL
jgi:hypothetical protein